MDKKRYRSEEVIRIILLWCLTMYKNIQKPKSRKEYDQMKRDGMNNQKSISDNKSINQKLVSNNKSIIEKCKKLIRRKNSES